MGLVAADRRRRDAYERRHPKCRGVAYIHTYTPPRKVEVWEVWDNRQILGLTSGAYILLDCGELSGVVGTRYLTCGDKMAVTYKGRVYWESSWLMDQFRDAAHQILAVTNRVCELRGWRQRKYVAPSRTSRRVYEGFARRINWANETEDEKARKWRESYRTDQLARRVARRVHQRLPGDDH